METNRIVHTDSVQAVVEANRVVSSSAVQSIVIANTVVWCSGVETGVGGSIVEADSPSIASRRAVGVGDGDIAAIRNIGKASIVEDTISGVSRRRIGRAAGIILWAKSDIAEDDIRVVVVETSTSEAVQTNSVVGTPVTIGILETRSIIICNTVGAVRIANGDDLTRSSVESTFSSYSSSAVSFGGRVGRTLRADGVVVALSGLRRGR